MAEPVRPIESFPQDHNAAPAKRRPRRAGRILLIILLVVLVLVVIAAFVAESVARTYADDRVRERVASALNLTSTKGIDVDLGSGSLILQAIGGSVDDARVSVDTVAVGDLRGSAVVTARDVPLDSNEPVPGLTIDFGVAEADVSALADQLSGSELDSVTLEGGDIQIATQFSVLGMAIPVTVALAPSASDGQLVFTPVDISAAGQSYTVDEMRSGPFADLAGTLLDSRSICVASQLPKALTLSAVKVDGDRLVLTLDGDGAVLGGGLKAKGSC